MDVFGPLIMLPLICGLIYFILKKQTVFTKKKKVLVILFAIFFFITEAGRSFYRPFIYENGINDFFIADTLGTGAGTLTAVFFVLLLQARDHISDMIYIAAVTLAIVLYEVFALPGNPVYDPADLYAAIICGAAAATAYYFLFLKRDWNYKKEAG
jgi:hypothetical protein